MTQSSFENTLLFIDMFTTFKINNIIRNIFAQIQIFFTAAFLMPKKWFAKNLKTEKINSYLNTTAVS